MMSVPGGGEGPGDILSIALEKSGVDSITPCNPAFLSSEMTSEFFTSLNKSNGDAFCQQQALTVSSNGYGVQSVADTSYQLMVSNGVGGGGVGEIGFDSRMDMSQVGVVSMDNGLDGLMNSNGSDCLQSYLPTISSVPSYTQPAAVNGTYESQSNNDIDAVLEELGIINSSPPETVNTPYSSSCSYSGMAGPVDPMGLASFTQQHHHHYSVQQPPPVMAYQQRPVISPMMPITAGSRTSMTPPLPASTPRKSPQALTPQPQLAEEDLDEEEDQFAAAETYANYRPAKLRIGIEHPDPIVESSSLSSVDPPQVWFDLKFPREVVEEAKLSSLQLEAVVYSCQQHMNILADGTRAGFLIGDGAGVGKGRTVAGIIYQNYLEGRKKAIWLSVSNDLKYDAIRDLQDVGASKIKVYSLNKFLYGKISGKRNGRVRKGVIFTTYSSLIGESTSGGKYRTRLNQLLHWLGSQFDGVIVFDECHKAKNLVPSGAGKPSKTGLTVLEMQKRLPKARVVYCSATGASEPRNMAYMSRLGIWGRGTQFPEFQDFIKSVERRGVGAMEIVAMDMKLRGLYIARQLSFAGVNFSIDEVPLTQKFIQMYDSSVAFWVEARAAFKEAAELMDYDKRGLKTMWAQFWASHQRFFKYLCIASKVDKAIELAKDAIKGGKCVVIGLQSTGEARTLEQLEQSNGELAGFVSTAKGVLEALVRKHFPAPTEGIINWSLCDNDNTLPSSCRKRKRAEGKVVVSESEESSSSGGDNDSAVESSSDEDDEDSDDDDDGDSAEDSNGGNKGELLDSLGIDTSWLTKPRTKAKRRKTATSRTTKRMAKNGNFSLKPPAASTPFPGVMEFKFNNTTLPCIKEEPFAKEKRRQSMVAFESAPKRSPPFERRSSVQIGMTDRHPLVDMAMVSGTNSCIRNVAVRKLKTKLMDIINDLSPHLPTNSLDHLVDGLGGPSCVAEMSGRRGRVVCLPDGTIQYQLRAEAEISVELLNITEKQRFMDGEKNVAIISEAASSGISLQADRRAKNQKRRVHITLELPWSADKAIQQFGRTHRSNQVNAPEYIFLISELSGEHRFASIVAKRLESLGALTHGDRRATESRDLSKYNIDNKYGRQSLETVLKSLVGSASPMVDMAQYSPRFADEARVGLTNVELLTHEREGVLSVDKESLNLSRFLNRLLGLPVLLQNSVFSYFMDTLAAYIQQAKRAGKWDCGIMDFGASEELVQIVCSKEFVGDAAFGTATTQLHKVRIERGISFSEALNKLNTDYKPGEGFYLSNQTRNGKRVAVMVKVSKEGSNLFLVHRPNTGLQSRAESIKHLLKKYYKSTPEDAEQWWTMQYEATLTTCIHACWRGRCKLGPDCETGRRLRAYHILTGSILGIWTQLERVFQRHPTHSHRMQIVRVHTTGSKLVGISIPTSCVIDLEETLQGIAEEAAGTAS